MGRKRTKSGKIRLTEVAKLAGVSPITASRFFRNPDALSLSKRERVDSAVKELGYVPNLAARALASHRTEVIGVVIPSLTNSVFADVLRGIYDSSEQSRYSIQLANTRYSILQEEKLLRLFRAQKPAGLIVTGINQTAESRAVLEIDGLPGRADHGDRRQSGRHDGGLFALRRQFCRDFAHSRARLPAHRISRRTHGSAGTAAVRRLPRRHEGGLAVRSQPHRHDYRADHGYARRHAVCRSRWRRAPDIDAVFCVNDDLALGVLFECQRRQISVPGNLAIVGFNDLEFMAAAVPSLTSVRTNRYEMGRHAVTMVIDAIEGRRPQAPVIDLGFQLMVRESSTPQTV